MPKTLQTSLKKTFEFGVRFSRFHPKKVTKNLKNPGLFRVFLADYTAQLCGDYFMNHCKDPVRGKDSMQPKRKA